MTSKDTSPLADRVFTLLWKEIPLARLRSLGGEMFWECFRVEPLVTGELLERLFDSAVWDRGELVLRHERTGIVVPHFFCPPGQPPARAQADGPITVLLRGTSFFPLPEASPTSWLRMLGRALVAPLRRWFK